MDYFKELLRDFEINEPASNEQIAALERAENLALPECYRDFLKRSNGGEGFVGESYAILWKTEEIAEFNRDYEVSLYMPGYLMIGSTGGGEGFAIKRGSAEVRYVQVPFIGMSEQDCGGMGNTFEEFLNHLAQASHS